MPLGTASGLGYIGRKALRTRQINPGGMGGLGLCMRWLVPPNAVRTAGVGGRTAALVAVLTPIGR